MKTQKIVARDLLTVVTSPESTEAEIRNAWAAANGTNVSAGELGYWPLDIAEALVRLAEPTDIADALVYLLARHYGDPQKS